MDNLFATAGTAAAVFAGTNVDDIIVLTVLFLSSRTRGRPRPWQIVTGQYAGIAALVALSAVAALGLTVVPDEWVGLLGLLPLGLGLWSLAGAVRAGGTEDGESPVVATGLLSVAGVTVANGADNISVYTPVFRTIGLTSSLVTVAVFTVLTALWCAAGSWLGSHPKVTAAVGKFGHWLVPGVFIVLGAVIVLESGILGRLAELL
ncbi:cadmium transporter [Planobispora rosea]|uniref:Cadmium transporter n=1 Tax=Planobispora rosea TaxID=35762 RepID=A0A8J3S601_PLARO|nr:cadmium resistance transporter [Planobispora rosea]GGT02393.1 cadmium transporter [Planobispora rosea]GIH88552.1 cadmium transporter [Planobispora rosea]